MLHLIAGIGLAPVLFAQGRRVRRSLPNLPEPSGPRSGVAGDGRRLRLLIVGDSAAAGVGAPTQSEALAGRVIHHLSPDHRVHWRLEAATGATTRATLDRLRGIPPAPFDVVVTSLGVNDVIVGSSVRGWIRRQARLVELLRTRFGAAQIVLSGLPPVHAFPALPQPLRWYLGSRSRRFDRVLRRWAEARGTCEFVAIDFTLDPALMASDGFHPGPEVYALWGRKVGERIRRRWRASA